MTQHLTWQIVAVLFFWGTLWPAFAAPTCHVQDPELQLEYAGACHNGRAHGQGVARGADGAWYRGTFEQGHKSGYGVKLYPNGDGYAGYWRNDMREGHGRYEYGDHSPWRGDVYQGEWQADQYNGKGTYIFFPSSDRFTADWVNGQTEDVGTTTITRRKQALDVLAPALGQPGQTICSVITKGAGPERVARGQVIDVLADRLLVRIDTNEVLEHSPDPTLNPRWEVLTEWMLCPTTTR